VQVTEMMNKTVQRQSDDKRTTNTPHLMDTERGEAVLLLAETTRRQYTREECTVSVLTAIFQVDLG